MLSSSIHEDEMNQKEPISVGFVILQCAKLTMLLILCNFFQRFCDPQKYELIEMDTDMAVSEEKVEEFIRP